MNEAPIVAFIGSTWLVNVKVRKRPTFNAPMPRQCDDSSSHLISIVEYSFMGPPAA